MKILKNIVTFLIVTLLAAFFAMSSFSFGESQEIIFSTEEKPTVHPAIARIIKNEDETSSIDKKRSETNQSVTLGKWEVWYIDFWLLSSAFVLSDQSGTLDFSHFSLSDKELTFDSQYSTVFSLYDPFTTYLMKSRDKDFAITQVTNGSFYVGTEKDATISIYSVDAVVRLDFLSDGEAMTDMMLFPGMYIRFDPAVNSSLKWANLFRILQSLEPDGTQDVTSNTTGIEFVNPRMNSSEDKDSFFMYKLPIQTNILFQMLHVLFYDKVSQIDLYKEYGISAYGTSITSSQDNNLLNPGKKSHFLLLKLDAILANAIQNTIPMQVFKRQISEINASAHTLAVWNDIQVRFERFLTDGRFALFGGTKINPQFPEIYQVISDEVGKTPVTAHAKLLQHLSDIYSKNLVAQKKDLVFSKIDTYSPTALELEKTLASSDLEQRDNFDIALYAFNVLKKAEEKHLFMDEAVYAHPTYVLIKTVLASTDRYVRQITDPERKNITYQGIALHFYEHMLGMLARSVYHTFMESQDGYLYLKSSFRPTISDPKIHIDAVLLRDFQEIDGILSTVSERLDAQYGVDSKNNTFLSVKKSIATFHSFAKILDYESYNEYIKLPYMVDDTAETLLPLYSSGGTIVSSDPLQKQIDTFQSIETANPSITTITGILWDIPRKDIIREADYYRINWTKYQFVDEKTGKTLEFRVSLVFDETIEKFSNLTIQYNDNNIILLTDKRKSVDLQALLSAIPGYISRYNDIMAGNPSLTWDIKFLENTQKIVIGMYPFPLVP